MGKTRDLGLEKLETEYLEYETFSSRQSHLDILIYTHTSLPSANLARAIIFQVPRYRLNRVYTSPHHIIHQYHSTTLHSISSGKFTSYIIRHSSSIIHHPLPIAHCPLPIVYRLSSIAHRIPLTSTHYIDSYSSATLQPLSVPSYLASMTPPSFGFFCTTPHMTLVAN